MNKLLKYSGLLALGVALIGFGMCLSEKEETQTIGILDNDKILITAAPFRAILGEEQKYLNALTARQAEDEKMLQTELAALQKKIKESGKSPNAFQKEVSEFQEKVVFYNQSYQLQKALIAKAGGIARQQLDPHVQAVLNEMGQAGYQIILPKKSTMYSASQTDVTADFIRLLDAKKIQIAFPNPAQLVTPTKPQPTSDIQNVTQAQPATETNPQTNEIKSQPKEKTKKK